MFVFGLPLEPIVGIAAIIAVFTALIITVRKDTYVPQAIVNYRHRNDPITPRHDMHYNYDRSRGYDNHHIDFDTL